MDIVLVPLLLLIKAILGIAIIVVITDVILGLLVSSRVLNIQNNIVYAVVDTLSRITEFMLAPIRKRMPLSIGMIDLSPVALILILSLLENMVSRILMRF